MYLVTEDHNDPNNIVNRICCFDIERSSLSVFRQDADFYSSLQLSTDGKRLAWVCWNFPFMSWDRSSIYVGDVDAMGVCIKATSITSDEASNLMPFWSISGGLYYVSDKDGFWNLYEWADGEHFSLYQSNRDFASAMWKLGRNSIGEVFNQGERMILASATQKGKDQLVLLGVKNHTIEDLELPFTSISHLVIQDLENVYFVGASPNIPRSLVRYDLKRRHYEIIKKSFSFCLSDEWISTPVSVEFSSFEKGKTSFAFYYPPKNPEIFFDQKKVPIIVRAHGGPTGHNPPILSQDILFWTSRGIGFLDVNYSGSTGFGREYRKRLNHQWGCADVADCILAARYLIEEGIADPSKIIIKGSSSGGFTAIKALCDCDIFCAAVSYYGIVDLELLTQDTHKFEKHYLDGLIGEYPLHKKRYIERSPIHLIEKINSPILLLQGEEDKVVLPEQSQMMYQKLKEKKISVEMIVFTGEGHGFRKAETIEKALEAELRFYKQLF
jgi:dipeptidyl aminopeptidase/acylaminoacyl peptidase